MAQMPINSMSGRADPFAALLPPRAATPPRPTLPRAAYLHDSSAIPGGRLRPGAVDQELFKAYLAAARKEAVLAPPATSGPIPAVGIPTLGPAQLAALGAVEAPAGELVIDIPAPNPADLAPHALPAAPGQAGGIAGGTGAPSAAPKIPVPQATDGAAPGGETPSDAPRVTEAPAQPGSSTPQATAERGPIPGSRRGADGAWELTRLPDKDEREMLRGQKWRVVESEAARRLFLGPDGAFGWDDFLDLVNPLQHIPFVNMAYRAITGDKIYGAARMVDVAFGPLAGVSTAVDLAFQDVTGAGMADNAVAALFGPSEAPADGTVSVSTASGSPAQVADAALIRRGSNR